MTNRSLNAWVRTTLRLTRFAIAGLMLTVVTTTASADDIMTVQGGEAAPGVNDVPIIVSFNNDNEIHGYSIALSFNNEVFTATGANEIGGYDPEYFDYEIDQDSGSVVLGAILALSSSADGSIDASPDTPVDMVEFTFDVIGSATPSTHEFSLSDGLGTPAIDNLFSEDGFDVEPDLVDGVFTIISSAEFFFEPAVAFVATPLTLEMGSEHLFDLQAYQVEINFDPDVLTLLDISTLPTQNLLEAESGEDDIEFELINLNDDDGYGEVAAICDYLPPFLSTKEIPLGRHLLVDFEFTVSVAVEAGDQVDVCFSEDFSGNLVTYFAGEVAVLPESECLTLDIETADNKDFVRGDSNADERANLIDVLLNVQWLFLEGPEPSCHKAADFDDDGDATLADSILQIEWLYLNGPDPEPPFPDCGPDDTDDDLECFVITCD